ncbi:MAG: F0F1 ATP synthase subunit gamma, partial [Candidatus Omnitrophica bacterium]|nr:F0F1 ATP synthase subunit gamma [Candidatus Omnitrophota bacterium]
MPQSLKAIKGRIKSIQNTRKVTNAMQMISVAKLNRVDKVLFALRPYALALENLLDNLVALQPEGGHPFLAKRSPAKVRALCVITSDNSLCGHYNTTVLRVAENFFSRYGQENVRVV